MELETKAVAAVEVKAEDTGEVLVRFATLGVRDLDGDLIEPGAIGKQKVSVSSFGHGSSYNGALPVGRGATREQGNEALADLQFFMDTAHGRDHFLTVKNLDELGQWSFRYEVKAWKAPTEEQRANGIVRVLSKLRVWHVGPVEVAAGIDTETISAKAGQVKAIKAGTATPTDPPPADPPVPPPTDDPTADPAADQGAPGPDEANAVAEAEAKAAETARLKALADEEYARFQRTRRRFTT